MYVGCWVASKAKLKSGVCVEGYLYECVGYRDRVYNVWGVKSRVEVDRQLNTTQRKAGFAVVVRPLDQHVVGEEAVGQPVQQRVNL